MRLLSPPQTAAADAPALPASTPGVLVAVSRQARGGPAGVRGAFQLPRAEAEALGRPVHGLLTCLVWSAGGYQDSLLPFARVVLFPDDETEDGNLVRGAFRFEIDLPPGDGFYLHVALGPYLSPSLCCPP